MGKSPRSWRMKGKNSMVFSGTIYWKGWNPLRCEIPVVNYVGVTGMRNWWYHPLQPAKRLLSVIGWWERTLSTMWLGLKAAAWACSLNYSWSAPSPKAKISVKTLKTPIRLMIQLVIQCVPDGICSDLHRKCLDTMVVWPCLKSPFHWLVNHPI